MLMWSQRCNGDLVVGYHPYGHNVILFQSLVLTLKWYYSHKTDSPLPSPSVCMRMCVIFQPANFVLFLWFPISWVLSHLIDGVFQETSFFLETMREAGLRHFVLNCKHSEFGKFHSDLLLPSPLFVFAWLIVSQSSYTMQYKICLKHVRESLSDCCQSLY